MKKFYIIDAYSFIYRFYFAYKNAQLMNKKGLPTAAIYGFLRFLLSVIKEDKPEYLAVAFDVGKPTFRAELYKEYKQNRLKMPDDLQIQIPYIKKIVQVLGIPTIELEGYEADDIIATLSSKFSQEAEVIILTGDKDAFQLVNDRVKIYHKHKDGTLYTPRVVEERFGVSPENVVDKLALMGDASDNIPGVKGIGEKTANALVQQFGTLENLYENLDKVSSPKLRNLLETQKDMAFLSKQLVILDKNLPLDFKLEDFKFNEPDYKALLPILEELEFNSIINELGLKQTVELRNEYEILADPQQLEKLITEKVCYVFFAEDQSQKFMGVLPAAGEKAMVYKLASAEELYGILNFFKNKSRIVTYDLKKVIRDFTDVRELVPLDVVDLKICYWLLGVSRRNYEFEQVIEEYLGVKIQPVEDGLFIEERIYPYVAQGAYALKLLYERVMQEFTALNLETIYNSIEKPLIYTLTYMERMGIKIDRDAIRRLREKVEHDLETLQKAIYDAAGEVFNINSTKQLQYILYEKLGIKRGRRTKTGYSTDEKTLLKLKDQHPIIEKILNYRELNKLLTTYITPLPNYVASDGRIHTTYNQTGTITGRLSSENPNLQNIPIREELGREIRKAFIAEKGFKLVSMDYSQIELRILAHFSKDAALIEAFKEGKDIHRATAARIFAVEEVEVTDEMRRFAKIINFSIIYGKTKYGLAEDLKIPVPEAEKYIDNYFALHSGVSEFLNKVVQEAYSAGYVRTKYGRVRFIPEIRSENFNEFNLGKRYAVNTIIQGTAADIIKLAMNRIYESELVKQDKARLLLQIHDELIFEVRHEIIDEAVAVFKHIMENVDDFVVPLVVNVGIGDNWYEAK